MQVITWNGLVFDFVYRNIQIKPQQIENTKVAIKGLIGKWPEVTFRMVAEVVGMLVSMKPVFGPTVQLRTRMHQNFVNIKHF